MVDGYCCRFVWRIIKNINIVNPYHNNRQGGSRIDLGLEVFITSKRKPDKIAAGVVEDISLTGAKVVCNLLFGAKEEVFLAIKLSSTVGGIFRTEAKTVRANVRFFEHGEKHEIAFRFCNLAAEEGEKLKSQLRYISDMIDKTTKT